MRKVIANNDFNQEPEEVKELEEQTLFEDASPEMLEESNKRNESKDVASKWSFRRYLKEIHTSPIKTLRDDDLPGATYGVYHMLLSTVLCFVMTLYTTMSSDIQASGPWEFITGVTYVSLASTLLVFSVLLFNNLLIGSFVYVFGKSLTIFNNKGDYKRFVRNLFPTTAVLATMQFVAIPLLKTTIGNIHVLIVSALIALAPAVISYCSVKTVGRKGVLVYIVLAAWIGVFYFIFGDKMGY